MFCVAGLGNPGETYKETRHNLGFRVVDCIAKASDTRIRRREFQALTATVRIGRSEVLLLKPQTYMNLCGRSVHAACHAAGIPVEQLIVVYDDADLALGQLRLRRGGGSGGHRGIESILAEVGASEFIRVRLGIGRPPPGMELAEWVLEQPQAEERALLDDLVERGAAAVREIIVNGLEAAMQMYNARPSVVTKKEE